ncbi:unnamed protein product [Arctia plantaginis]|uniref:Uncharacterized protein n=1 Tax=Arctia plantaginis TaxID=874455 RepID=A0A8S0ZBU7_ARCPL|nr:unnamed protein product [Arctia plantaginis]
MESPRQSDSDTVEYWKKQAKYYEQKVIDIQQELDEYTENSAQLEKELEASLVQVEKQNRDLENQNQRLKNDIEMLRNKLERSQHETNALENEVKALKIDKDKQGEYIRELEQKNDDLERGQRVISESVSCIESLLNQAYERNAVLESEVDEVETLRVRLQRATDEARDLKQELKVMERVPKEKKLDDSTNENSLFNGHSPNPSRTQVEIETQTSLMSPQKREINGNAMTPSSRVTAINIVGDLLRKVGALESKLASCRGTVRPKEHSPNSASDVNKDYRKGFYSINCQIVCSAKGKIIGLNPNFPGSTHDAAIWRASTINHFLKSNFLSGERNQWLLDDNHYDVEIQDVNIVVEEENQDFLIEARQIREELIQTHFNY